MSIKFRRLLAQHENQVYSLANYLLRDSAEAQDVAQETFIKLWHHLDSVNPDQRKAWLMKVTRNACLDRLRKRRFTTEVDESLSDHGPGPDASMANQQLAEVLNRAVAGLKEPYRSLVLLRDVQQNSYRDVANALELSLEQVKVYLYRARRQLRDRLQEAST